jgi:cryptochrome
MPMVNHAVASRSNMERIKQVYQQLVKYRTPSSGMMMNAMAAKAQHMSSNQIADSPSPTTILTNLNNSGNLMCRSTPAHHATSPKIITYHQSNLQTLHQNQINLQQSALRQNMDQQYSKLMPNYDTGNCH